MFASPASDRRIALYRDQSVSRDFARVAQRLGWTDFVRAPIRKIPYDASKVSPADFYATVKNQGVVVLIEHLAVIAIDYGAMRDLNDAIGWYASMWACWICGVPPPPPASQERGATSQSEMEAADERFWSFVDSITEVKLAAE